MKELSKRNAHCKEMDYLLLKILLNSLIKKHITAYDITAIGSYYQRKLMHLLVLKYKTKLS